VEQNIIGNREETCKASFTRLRMWVIIQEPKSGGAIKTYECGLARWALPPGSSLLVAREGGDIRGAKGDTTVSKQHAKITAGEAVPGGKPEVWLEDIGSMFGTFLNEEILSESQRLASSKETGKASKALKEPRRLRDNDRIRFGVMTSFYRLKWVTFRVTSSMLKAKDAVEGYLEAIAPGTQLQPQWTNLTSHLVMTSISLSLKVVNCLASGVPIVTPEYFRDFLAAADSKQALPVTSDYTPPVTESQSESQLRDPNISFKVDSRRAKLFTSLTFIFQTEKEFQACVTPIQLAGGSARIWSPKDEVEKASEPGVVVMQPPSSVRNSQTPAAAQWKRISNHLAGKGLATTQSTHIYLAIVHCSTATFCNPRRQTPSVLPKQSVSLAEGRVIALESQSQSAQPFAKPAPVAAAKSRADSAVSVSTMSSAAPSTMVSLRSQPTPASLLSPAQNAAPSPAPSTSGRVTNFLSPAESTQPLSEMMSECVEPSQDLSKMDTQLPSSLSTQDIVPSAVLSRKRNREDGTVEARESKRGREELDGDKADRDKISKSKSIQNSVLKESGLKDFFSKGEKVTNQDQDLKANNLQLKSRDMFDTSPLKSTPAPATQIQDSKLESAILGDDDDEDIFGFGDQPSRSSGMRKHETNTVAAPMSRKRNKDGEDEDDIFGFSPVKKVQSGSTQRCQLKETTSTTNSALVHSPPKKLPLSIEKVTPGKKGVIMDTSVIFQGFIGKGDISLKPKPEKVEGDEESQLSKSFCKVTLNISLLRTSQPRPSYVPAPEPELLGRPTPNFKNFKKQVIGRASCRAKVPFGKYTESKNKPGVEEWLAQNPDVSRVEAEEEARHKQEDGFWDFLNSQEVKNSGRMRR